MVEFSRLSLLPFCSLGSSCASCSVCLASSEGADTVTLIYPPPRPTYELVDCPPKTDSRKGVLVTKTFRYRLVVIGFQVFASDFRLHNPFRLQDPFTAAVAVR